MHIIYPLLVGTLIHHLIEVTLERLPYRTRGTVIICALALDVRNWLWHLTMNTGEKFRSDSSFIEPMLALAVPDLPSGDWLYEVKFEFPGSRDSQGFVLALLR